MITNLINNKSYIGKRLCPQNKTPETDKYMSSSYILNGYGGYNGAYKKYGIENFKKEILIKGEYSQDEINELEKYYIWLAKAIGKAEYNLAKGGDGGQTQEIIWNKGKAWSSEIRKRISEKNKQYCGEKHSQWGTHRSEETKKKLSEANQKRKENGFIPWNKGKSGYFSEEILKNMKEKISKKLSGKNNPNAKKVICVNNGKIFDTSKEASLWAYKGTTSGICTALKFGNYSGYDPETKEKLYWKFYEN